MDLICYVIFYEIAQNRIFKVVTLKMWQEARVFVYLRGQKQEKN